MEALGKDVIFDESHITTDYTIRELTDFYLKELPWGDLGIDIGLGLPMDKKAAPLEYMFLPDYVESAFDHASIVQNGSTVPLVKEKHITYEARAVEPTKSLPHPLYVSSFIALLSAGLASWDLKRKKASTWFDIFLFWGYRTNRNATDFFVVFYEPSGGCKKFQFALGISVPLCCRHRHEKVAPLANALFSFYDHPDRINFTELAYTSTNASLCPYPVSCCTGTKGVCSVLSEESTFAHNKINLSCQAVPSLYYTKVFFVEVFNFLRLFGLSVLV